jgi:DNA topoisomerase VI subunit A
MCVHCRCVLISRSLLWKLSTAFFLEQDLLIWLVIPCYIRSSIFHHTARVMCSQVPSRGNNNQQYIKEIDRIVLKDKMSARFFASLQNGQKCAITTRIIQLIYELCVKKIHVTKRYKSTSCLLCLSRLHRALLRRDLFYTDVKLFGKQANTDDILDDVACIVGCTRSSLNGSAECTTFPVCV